MLGSSVMELCLECEGVELVGEEARSVLELEAVVVVEVEGREGRVKARRIRLSEGILLCLFACNCV